MSHWTEISRFFDCDCGAEAVHVSTLHLERSDGFDAIGLSFWRCGKASWRPFKYRLSYIWDIIRYGEPHLDEIILDKRTAKEMGELLIELSEKMV